MTRIYRSPSNSLATDAAALRDSPPNHPPQDSHPSHSTRQSTMLHQLKTINRSNPISGSAGHGSAEIRHANNAPPASIPLDSASKISTTSDQPDNAYDISDLTKQLSVLTSLAGGRIAEIGIRAARCFAEMEQQESRKPPFKNAEGDEVPDGRWVAVSNKRSK